MSRKLVYGFTESIHLESFEVDDGNIDTFVEMLLDAVGWKSFEEEKRLIRRIRSELKKRLKSIESMGLTETA